MGDPRHGPDPHRCVNLAGRSLNPRALCTPRAVTKAFMGPQGSRMTALNKQNPCVDIDVKDTSTANMKFMFMFFRPTWARMA